MLQSKGSVAKRNKEKAENENFYNNRIKLVTSDISGILSAALISAFVMKRRK